MDIKLQKKVIVDTVGGGIAGTLGGWMREPHDLK
jgi:hypothetical protein